MPSFITAPGEADPLMVGAVVFLIVLVLVLGSTYFWQHSIPERIAPGSSCIVNAYTNNHDQLDDPGISTSKWVFLHVIDTVGVVHAIILRVQALLLPVQTLVLSGGH